MHCPLVFVKSKFCLLLFIFCFGGGAGASWPPARSGRSRPPAGGTYEAERGKTILEVARGNDIWIPTLCYDKRLDPYGGCRICLVEVKGARQLVISCTTVVGEGMVVNTESENVIKTRSGVLDYILSDHPLDCMTCEANGC